MGRTAEQDKEIEKKEFDRLMESDEAIDCMGVMDTAQSRRIRAMSLIARGKKDKEICAMLGIHPNTLRNYKKDDKVKRGVASIQAKIVQKTELIVDSVAEKRLEVAQEAQGVLREIMLDMNNKSETRLRAAAYLVEPLTRYFQNSTQTSTMTFDGQDPSVLLDDIQEIKYLLNRDKNKKSDND